MTLADALDAVVAATKHARYRELCDPAHPAFNAAYIPIVFAMARGESPKPTAPSPIRVDYGTAPPDAPPRRNCCGG